MLVDKLIEALGNETVFANEPLYEHTTFQIGGPADAFVTPHSADDINTAIRIARECGAEWHVMGAGSNILVSDDGIRGVVICIGKSMADIQVDGTKIVAQAGALNKDVAKAACDAGLTGYEFAAGIPGSIGGAAIMNAGAYEGEFKDVCTSVTCLTPQGEVVEVEAADADWSYRHSMMSDKGYIILAATLDLVPWNREQIQARMDDLQERRESKQPLELGSAGSTFKRPVGYFAGKLIQDAGMRGHTVGSAQVSTKHCGFVVNLGGASAEEVRAVIRDVQEAVLADAGVHLECEVRMWGFDDDDL